MSEMVERVARAIDPVAWDWIDRTRQSDPNHMALQQTVTNKLNAARAAILAMRNPTAGVLGVREIKFGSIAVATGGEANRGFWEAMIDAALR